MFDGTWRGLWVPVACRAAVAAACLLLRVMFEQPTDGHLSTRGAFVFSKKHTNEHPWGCLPTHCLPGLTDWDCLTA